MNMTAIKAKAKSLGVPVGSMPKKDLIRTIQAKEGNFPCFETAKEYCSQTLCCWRDACLPSKKTISDWEMKKKTYTAKLSTELKDLKKQLTDLEKKTKKMVGKGKEDAQKEINNLKKMMSAFTVKIKKLTTASEDAWKITKKGIDDAWKDLSKAFTLAAKKFK